MIIADANDYIFECFGKEVKKIQVKEIKNMLKENILAGFFFPFCRIGLALLFLTPPHQGKNY